MNGIQACVNLCVNWRAKIYRLQYSGGFDIRVFELTANNVLLNFLTLAGKYASPILKRIHKINLIVKVDCTPCNMPVLANR